MRRWVFALAAMGMLAGCAATGTSAPAARGFVAATVTEGRAIVLAPDEFTAEFTPADISIRLQQTEGGTEADVRGLYADQVVAWTPEEEARLAAMAARNRPALDALDAWIPDTLLFVKNTARLDGGLPHTRANAIFFGPTLPEDDAELDGLFFHELFHVMSRANANRRDELYGSIGFQRCTSFDLPAGLRARMFTNPDAPTVEYVVPQANPSDNQRFTTPVLTADPPHYDPATNFTGYFEILFIDVRRSANGACTTVAREDGDVARFEMREAVGMLFAHAGRNTNYVLHPEELMADNFSQMMTRRADAPDPWVYERLAGVLGIPVP